ncbi:iron ABC transporter permease [Thiospirochaeta perfilievii]|uniref:Iron ABC transporter permease n=2 Tax=Thiospirochaeta perfilievii TaxID=252967 RepID=A0A5C1QIL7_9SPIO|nr:iron ABC transporter permease [Thiospirochaeta perfilievii]
MRIKVVIILTTILLSLSLLELILGNTYYPIPTILRVLNGESVKGATFAIMKIRLPRMLSGVLVGLALGIAGNTFQVMLKNPLASPDIIGISTGSSVGALFSILVLNYSGSLVSISALMTGLTVASLIYLFSQIGGFSGSKLILIGIGVQGMMGSIISYLLLKAPQYDIPAAYRWLSGNLNGVQMSSIPLLLYVVLFFGTIILLMERYLKVLELGDSSATTLGVKTGFVRVMLIVSSVYLISYSTSVTGPIAFISFLSGPISRKIYGTSSSIGSSLVGGIIVLAGDLIGQNLFSVRLPVGIITGMLGTPYLVLQVVEINKRGVNK